MAQFSYRQVNVAQLLAYEWELGASNNTVLISIYDMDDNSLDVNAVAMTNETSGLFSYAWTPTEEHNYRVDFYNQTLDSHQFEIVKATTSSSGGGSSTGSTQNTLRNKFLKLIDNYNPNDLSGTNSSGELADICINDALQTIYATIKASRNLESYASLLLISTANQAYIELSAITDIDEIRSIKDTTNHWTLKPVSADWYFRNVPDPGAVTGTPHQYCRIFNRIYLNPRPTSAITYTTEYIKLYPELASNSDTALIPSKYDRWIMAEAWVIWLLGEDPTATGSIQIAQAERERCEMKFLNDMFSSFDHIPQGASHFLENENRRWLPYDSPIDGT